MDIKFCLVLFKTLTSHLFIIALTVNAGFVSKEDSPSHTFSPLSIALCVCVGGVRVWDILSLSYTCRSSRFGNG